MTTTGILRTFKGLPLPKTPSPHRELPYSVERFMRDFDSRERARMGVVMEEKSIGFGREAVKLTLASILWVCMLVLEGLQNRAQAPAALDSVGVELLGSWLASRLCICLFRREVGA